MFAELDSICYISFGNRELSFSHVIIIEQPSIANKNTSKDKAGDQLLEDTFEILFASTLSQGPFFFFYLEYGCHKIHFLHQIS